MKACARQFCGVPRPRFAGCCLDKAGSVGRGALFADPQEEVGNDDNVQEKDEDVGDCGFTMNLNDLERNERGRNDGGEPFGPGLHEPQSYSFCEEEGGIDEAANAEISEIFRGNVRQLGEGEIEIATSWSEAEFCREVSDDVVGVIVMEQAQSADACYDQDEGFEELVGSENAKQPVVLRRHATPCNVAGACVMSRRSAWMFANAVAAAR